VSDFENLAKKAEAYAQEHPEEADKAVTDVEGFAERETDHQHDEQIERAADFAEKRIGQGEGQRQSEGESH
jgi:MT0933-like antitoxin protein